MDNGEGEVEEMEGAEGEVGEVKGAEGEEAANQGENINSGKDHMGDIRARQQGLQQDVCPSSNSQKRRTSTS